jgi:hypothetical protein
MEVTVTIPDNIYEEVESVAKKQNRSVEEVLSNAIMKAFERFPLHENHSQMAREKEAYKQLHPKLWEQYPNQYVAVTGGEVVDHDEDMMRIYERIEAKYPDTVVLLEKVLSVPDRILRVPSFRFIRDKS